MDKVLVFTNCKSWYLGFPKITKKVDWYDFYPDLNNPPLVKCVTEPGTKTILRPVDDFSDEGVYLVYDQISKDVLAPLLDECKRDNDKLFILLHTHGNFTHPSDFAPWKEICSFAKGIHETGEKHKYELVFKILTDNVGDKTNRIVESVFKTIINAVIAFLLECLTPKKCLEDTRSYQVLCQEGFADAMKAFKAKYDSCNSFSEYEEDYNNLQAFLMEVSKNSVILQS